MTARRKYGDRAGGAAAVRDRIIDAAFGLFRERGFGEASTLEIATRARVSKRELYSHFKSKEALFAAGIAERSNRMRLPLSIPDVTNRAGLEATLMALGRSVLSGIVDEGVIAVYRLAIAETVRSTEIARTLDASGRGAIRRAVDTLFRTAQGKGLVGPGEPATMTFVFCSLLLSDVQLRLVLQVRRKPGRREIEQRARLATDAVLKLFPPAASGQGPQAP